MTNPYEKGFSKKLIEDIKKKPNPSSGKKSGCFIAIIVIVIIMLIIGYALTQFK